MFFLVCKRILLLANSTPIFIRIFLKKHTNSPALQFLFWAESDYCAGLNVDNFVKSPSAALRFILPETSGRRTASTPHSFGFARLASGAFYFVVFFRLFTGPSTFEL
jgi:hypothetical protein